MQGARVINIALLNASAPERDQLAIEARVRQYGLAPEVLAHSRRAGEAYYRLAQVELIAVVVGQVEVKAVEVQVGQRVPRQLAAEQQVEPVRTAGRHELADRDVDGTARRGMVREAGGVGTARGEASLRHTLRQRGELLHDQSCRIDGSYLRPRVQQPYIDFEGLRDGRPACHPWPTVREGDL